MKEFEQIIKQLIALFKEFQPLEEEKLKAAEANQVTVIEDCMTKEQAMVLKLRGLENKRTAIQKQMGWEGMSFREILAEVSEEDAARLKPLFEELERMAVVFQSTNESALDIINLHLREIQKTIDIKSKGEGYNQAGQPKEETSNLTNQKV